MVLYYCKICNKPFDIKCNYIRHLKTHITDTTVKDTIYKCEYCEKIFQYGGKLKNHIEKVCKNAPNQLLKDKDQIMEIRLAKMRAEMEANIEEKLERMNNEKRELERRLNIHDKQITEITETINEIQETPIINVNIENVIIKPVMFINNFKDEPSIIEILSHAQLQSIVEKGGNAVRTLIEYKHYNRENPSNHNVVLKKKKGTMAQIFNGNKYIDTPIEDLLNYLITKSQDEITAILKLPNIKITYNQQRNINRLQENIKYGKPETLEMLKEELIKLMYNNYELVMNTYRDLINNIQRKAITI